MGSVAGLKNRAVIYSEPGTVKTEVVELPVQEPGAGEVLVRLQYSGVCHTDYGFLMNLFSGVPFPTPQGVGEIVALGPGVTEHAIGARVGIKYAADACLNCGRCLQGGESSCNSVKISGYFTPGTFQQYVISYARYVTPIPDNIDLAGAGPLMCGGVTVYTALKRAGIKHGDWVAIAGGGGGLGHLAIQYAKAMGGRPLAVDLKSKEQLCRDLGAEEFLDFTDFKTDEELAKRIQSVTGTGANIVLMCSSNKRAYLQAQSWLAFRGVFVALGVPEGESPRIADVMAMLGEEQTFLGVKTGNRLDAKESVEIASRGLVKPVFQLRRMESLSNIFQEMEEGKIAGRVVLDLR